LDASGRHTIYNTRQDEGTNVATFFGRSEPLSGYSLNGDKGQGFKVTDSAFDHVPEPDLLIGWDGGRRRSDEKVSVGGDGPR
jgi:hypothetical protein